MQNYFEICPSATQLKFLQGGHGLVALALVIYVESMLMMLATVTLVGLLAVRESRRLRGEGIITLKLDSYRASIEFEQGGQPYFYRKYKVYATRWFAILRLIDKQETRTLILNPDRFDSVQSYRQLRYVLRNMEYVGVA